MVKDSATSGELLDMMLVYSNSRHTVRPRSRQRGIVMDKPRQVRHRSWLSTFKRHLTSDSRPADPVALVPRPRTKIMA